MSDAEVPADLLALKIRFRELEAEQKTIANAMPPASAIITGQAAPTAEQQAGWARVQTALTETAVQIRRILDALPAGERLDIDAAANKAANAAVAAGQTV